MDEAERTTESALFQFLALKVNWIEQDISEHLI